MGGVDVQLHLFLTLALEGCEWSTSCHTHFTSGKEARYPLSRRLGRTKGWYGHLEAFHKIVTIMTMPSHSPQTERERKF